MDAQIAETLQAHEIRPTVQRIALYHYLLDHHDHPTADAIYRALHPAMPTFSKTTVYNTLKLFEQHGLVQAIGIEDGEVRYDANTHYHLHFKCRACGSITDIVLACDALPVLPANYADYSVDSAQCFLWGLCPECGALRARH